MSASAARTRITPEKLANLQYAKKFELVDGELVERHVSIRSGGSPHNASRATGRLDRPVSAGDTRRIISPKEYGDICPIQISPAPSELVGVGLVLNEFGE